MSLTIVAILAVCNILIVILLIKYVKEMNKVFGLVKLAYSTILRDLVVKAIDNPDSEIDEFVLGILDRIFDYKN